MMGNGDGVGWEWAWLAGVVRWFIAWTLGAKLMSAYGACS